MNIFKRKITETLPSIFYDQRGMNACIKESGNLAVAKQSGNLAVIKE